MAMSRVDLSKWRLLCEDGRQRWFVDGDSNAPGREQNKIERYHLGTQTDDDFPPLSPPDTVSDSIRNAVEFYTQLQWEDGHWSNDYGGPMFLMPGLIIACYVTGTEIAAPKRAEMIRYLLNEQREDGGWGLHIESPSTMFGSALSYVSLRILGLPADHDAIVRGREFIRKNGRAPRSERGLMMTTDSGAIGTPSWGKFWLAVLGVYEWDGLNPIPPEFWLLPYALPMHPGRWWCHCRMVYLPMGVMYGGRYTGERTELVMDLRQELFDDYDNVKWSDERLNCCALDLYTPHSRTVRFTNWTMGWYEWCRSTWLRKRAEQEAMKQIHAEDENTDYICIGPVNKVINMLCVWFTEGDGERFQKHVARLDDYLWLGRDGMKMQGYNGCQLWDTAFAVQAIAASGLGDQYKESLIRGAHFLDVTQVRDEVEELERHYRHRSVGAWPFSTRDHGWPISDCTAEGLKACLALREFSIRRDVPHLADRRLEEAIDVILSLQNSNGGWATYELQRGPSFLEALNPSETFHGIMVDYPYVECSSACVQAMSKFRAVFPKYKPLEIEKSIQAGLKYIKKVQRDDGSWKGSWAVCFTYATWFGVEALVATGHEKSPEIDRACEFLLSKQNEDGGWGESFQSCVEMQWVPHPDGSQVVNTAWAVISLVKANQHRDAVEKGVEFLRSRQLPNGDWELEGVSGVFNANCAISYNSYKNIFPLWAMSLYEKWIAAE